MTATAELNDPLDDLFGAPRRTEPVQPPAHYQPQSFTEPCRKCGGTGRFRNIGPCFTCKGKGKRTYKTSPQERAGNRASRANNLASKIEAFKAEHAEAYAWLVANVDRFEFATSLWHKLRAYGSLTDGQIGGIATCIAKNKARAKERAELETARVAAAPSINITKIEEAFERARNVGKIRPKLRLDTFKFKPAASTSKNAGSIYVTEGEEYLGRITAGKFLAVRTCGDERQARVIAAAANPQAAAIAYGLRTGVCSCCGAELTNAESIARGIGPICADKYGW